MSCCLEKSVALLSLREAIIPAIVSLKPVGIASAALEWLESGCWRREREHSADSRVALDDLSFEQVVGMYYQPLYRFALGLTGRENDAWDLTQQTFYRWATKGHQLEDKTKVKSWLFTTLHREFLNSLRRQHRFPHLEVESVARELPVVPSSAGSALDGHLVMEALRQIDQPYRSALLLFYLEEHSYKEIAEILDVPEGTVMSRISRGKVLLRQALDEGRPTRAAEMVAATGANKVH
jgi:RNA polymerase sigma-70 factor, ECF subfamily